MANNHYRILPPSTYQEVRHRLSSEAAHYRQLAVGLKKTLWKDTLDIARVASFFIAQIEKNGKAPDPVPVPATLEEMTRRLSMSKADAEARVMDVITATHCNFQLYDFPVSDGHPG